MKAMIFSDLITSKNSVFQLLGITLFVSVFIAVGTGTLVTAVACMATMVPFMYLFSISAYDEQNGWERFRLTLPISRRQVAYGRYASMFIIMLVSLVVSFVVGVLIGLIAEALPSGMLDKGISLSEWGVQAIFSVGIMTQAIILVAAAVSLPFIMRFGVTKGSRLVPVILILALSAGVAFFTNNVEFLDLDAIAGNIESVFFIAMAVIVVIALVMYCASAYLSARLYEKREL